MRNEKNDVYQINSSFYQAFEKLSIEEMEKVWARESYVQCFHPGWGMLRGWGPVMASWQRIFENTEEIRFSLTEISVEVRDSLAWVTQYENITSALEGQVVRGMVLAMNLFEKRREGWRMIHHHGSAVVQSSADIEPPAFH